MNHPLPKSLKLSSQAEQAYEFVKADEVRAEPVEVPVPMPAFRRLRDQVATTPDADDPYEAYRQRILQAQAERVEHVRRTMPPLPAQALQGEALATLAQRDYYYDPQQYYTRTLENAQPPAPEPFFKGGFWSKGLAFASLAALVAGSAVGFALTKKQEIGATATRTLAYVGAMLPADRPQPVIADASASGGLSASTTIAKKPIATATLDVADVSGELNSSIALPLRADPASADQDLSIRITGLPADAVVTPGRKIADQTWVLNDEDLASARLVVPHADSAVFDVSVAAIETKSGELAAPVREMKVAITNADTSPATQQPAPAANQSVVTQAAAVVTSAPAAIEPSAGVQILPANAAPERQGAAVAPTPQSLATINPIPPAAAPTAVTAQPPNPVALGLLQKGDVLFKAGDLMMARQFYLRAHDLGAAEGALGVARTYDPAVFKELKVEGLMPDAAQAHEWYRKASQTGLPEALSALARFETTAALP